MEIEVLLWDRDWHCPSLGLSLSGLGFVAQVCPQAPASQAGSVYLVETPPLTSPDHITTLPI